MESNPGYLFKFFPLYLGVTVFMQQHHFTKTQKYIKASSSSIVEEQHGLSMKTLRYPSETFSNGRPFRRSEALVGVRWEAAHSGSKRLKPTQK